MKNQQHAMQSIADIFGGSVSLDQALGMALIGAMCVAWVAYSFYHHHNHEHRSPFDSLH
jgi:hypothetical protein